MTQHNDWIHASTHSLAEALLTMDLRTIQPLDCVALHHMYAREWVNYCTCIMQTAKKKKISFETLAKLFPNPSAISIQILYMMLSFKSARIRKKQRLSTIAFFLTILSRQRKKDIFVNSGKNITHSTREIQLLLKKIPFKPATPEIARQLGRIYLGGSHLVNGLYTDLYTDFGIEVSGPYDASKKLGKNHTLVIKELMHLQPRELFSLASKNPAHTIQVYSIYQNVKTKIDPASCHFTYKGNPINGLKYWALLVNGKPITSMKKIELLEKKLSQQAVKQWELLQSLSFEQVKHTMLMQRCYLFKGVCDYLGLEWQPTRAMVQAIKGKKLPKIVQHIPKEMKKQRTYWIRLLDPRTEFYG